MNTIRKLLTALPFAMFLAAGNLVAQVPVNDNFENADVIASASGTADVDTSTATSESGEPAHYTSAPRHTLWWTFMPLTNGTLVVDTEGSVFDTVLALYMGSSLATLQKLDSNDSAGDDVMYSRIEVLLAAGTSYHIALDGYAESDSGAAYVNWAFTPLAPNNYIVTLTAPQVIGYPSNIVVTGGAPYGVLPHPSVYGYAFNGWWSGMGGTGDLVTNAISVSQSANHALYAQFSPKTSSVTFDANGSTVPQQVVEVTFGMAWPAITTPTRDGYLFDGWYTLEGEPIDLGSLVALESDLSVFAEWVALPLPPPDNDTFATASVIATDAAASVIAIVAGSTQVTTAMASAEPEEPAHYGGAPRHTLWWTFIPRTNGTLVVDTEGSSFDTVLALYTGSSLTNLQKLASNDSAGDDVLHSRIELQLEGGTTYHIALDGYADSESGAACLNWVFTPFVANSYILTLTGQSVSGVVPMGQTARLSVSNSVTAPFGYQWIKDGVMLIGQTNSTLSFNSFTFTDSGSYSVVITNTLGMAISMPAILSTPNAPLRVWGRNEFSQLGNGTTNNANLPIIVASNVVATAGGAYHSLFVKSDGTLWAMGFNSFGQLGNGSTANTNRPIQVASNVVAAAGGSIHSLFVKADGTLWAMGYNFFGQLGDGTTATTNLPVQVSSNVVAVAAGGAHSLFVNADGTLWAMGQNSFGQLGNGTTANTNRPVQVASNVVAVAGGAYHSLFVKSDGTLWVMGYNGEGELGIGTTANTNLPVQVASNVVAAAGGYTHSLFIKVDGTLWAMGQNNDGQLGNGTTAPTNRPVQVASNVVSTTGGSTHSLFVKADGTLWAMGRNSAGQLGNGSATSTNLPVQVSGGLLIAGLSKEPTAYHSLAIAGALPAVFVSNRTVTVGQTTNFTAIITGDGPFTYQWQKNGANIVDATNGSYTVSSAVWSDVGHYAVVVAGAYGITTSAVARLTVKADQTITFPDISGKVTTDTVGLSATASSGLPVLFSVLSGDASISDGTNLTFRSAGSVSIVASQAGDSNYNAAPDATSTFSVTKAMASVSLSNTNQTYDGTAKSVSVTTVPDGQTVEITYNSSTTAPTNAGSYTVVATVNEIMYQGGETGTLTIAKASQTVSFPGIGVQLTTNTVRLVATASSGLPASFSVLSGSALISGGTNLTFSGAGIVRIVASQAGDANWNAAPHATNTFTVSKVTPSVISWPTASVIRQGQTLAASTLSGGVGSVDGTFTFATSGSVPAEGTDSQDVIFTPVDTNSYNSVSGSVSVTVVVPPAITTQPVSAVVMIGQEVTLNVFNSGTAPFGYQWIKDGVMLIGQTNNTLSFNSFTFTDSGSYSVVITNTIGTAISLPASLSTPNAPLRVWGKNDDAQLGNGRAANTNLPITVASNVVAAAGGRYHSLLVKADGTLWSMGYNSSGQLGNGTTANTNRPVQVASNVVAAAGGSDHSLFVKSDGTLWAMGYNNCGQLGNGTTANTNLPVQVASNVVSVAGGSYHSRFVKADGTLWAMGQNSFGLLGNGTTANTNLPVLVASHVVAAAGGWNHSLFVKADGTLWAMGYNAEGQLGIGTVNRTSLPVLVASHVVAVASGANHSLFVKADGTLWAMGSNNYGQLGNGTTAPTNRPVQVASNVVSATGGSTHSLFVKTDGTLWAMGQNSSGQLGNGTTNNANLPVQVSGSLLTAGLAKEPIAYHSLAIAGAVPAVTLSNLTVTVAQTTNFTATVTGDGPFTYQWQKNGANILDATNDAYTVSSAVWSDAGNYAVVVAGACGSTTSADATLTVNKAVQTIVFPVISGKVTTDTVRLSATASSGLPVLFSVLSGSASISGGTNLTFSGAGIVKIVASQAGDANWNAAPTVTNTFTVSKATPSITSWPTTSALMPGQTLASSMLSNGAASVDGAFAFTVPSTIPPVTASQSVTFTPTQANLYNSVTGSVSVIVITAPAITEQPMSAVVTIGQEVTLSVSNSVTALHGYQWIKDGVILAGQTNRTLSFSSFTFTDSGSYSVVITNILGMAISMPANLSTPNAPLRVWGQNNSGQLGNGTTANTNLPIQVASNVVAAAGGAYHSLFVKADGTLWAMGQNGSSQLGNGTTANTNLPIQVASNVVATAGGSIHSLFVKADGTLWGMGHNNTGQLGNGTWANTNLPVQVASNVVATACGNMHSLFVKADGTLWAMGQNSDGQLGNGTTVNTNLPVQVASNVVAVVAGYYHSLFVKADGTLWAMGYNSAGQLGNGTTVKTNLPVQVTSHVVSVTGGSYHSLFVKTDGTLWAMGQNSSGQLGNGTTTPTNRPVQVASNVLAATGGYSHSLFVKADGTLWAMGENSSGQLGNGTTNNANLPVQVSGGLLIAGLAKEPIAYHSLAISGALPVVFVSNRTVTFGQTTNFTATVTGDGPFTYQWQKNGTNIVDATNGTYTISSAVWSDVGNYAVVVAGAYGITTSADATLTVGKASQTVNFENIGDQLTTNIVALSATATSGLSVTNFSVVSGPAVISATSLSFTNSGSVTLSAVQDGNADYDAAETTFTFSVTKAVAEVSLSNTSQTYDGTTKSVSVTTVPAGRTVSVTYNSSATLPVNAGSYTVVATVNEIMYQGGAAGTLTIEKASQTVSFAGIGVQLTNNTVRLVATASSGLPVSFSVLSGSALISDGTNLTFSSVGSVTIVASQAGDANWNAAPHATNTFNVTVSGFNHAPVGTANTVTLLEDTTYAFGLADFGFTDPNDSPANNFAAVKITMLPGAGTLSSGGSAVTNGQRMITSSVGETWQACASNRSWYSVASSVDGTKLVAVVKNGQIYTSTDSGVNWTARATNRNWACVASSSDGTKLVAAAEVGQLYTSTDSGANWTARGNIRTWRNVASSTNGTKLVAVASGGQIYTSTDSGTNWTARASELDWTPVASSADGTKLVAAVWSGQIYTSKDSGVTWTARESARRWRSVASSADGTKLVAAVENIGQIYTSTDSGTNWTARESSRNWRSVASSADGSKLVASVYGGQLYTSKDGGTNWTARESSRNWSSVASSADGSKLVGSVYSGQIYITQASLDLTFTPAANAYGNPYSSFTFQVQDDGGTANGGVDLDPTPKTMTLHVTAVPDDQTISFSTIENKLTTDTVGLSATASSGLAVSFSVLSGFASISGETNLTFSGAGSVSIVASQAGDSNYNAALTVTNTFMVNKVTPSVTIWPTASDLMLGQTLAASVLSGGTSSAVGAFAFTEPETVPALGTASQDVTFTPIDMNRYNSVTGFVNVTVVIVPPSITAQPISAVVTMGQAAGLSVSNSGSAPLSYQWLKDGVILLGQTNSTLNFASFKFVDSGSYSVVITNELGMVISLPASLSVPNAPLWAMGMNGSGQLGNGTMNNANLPIQVASNVVATACGGDHSLFVNADGTLWAMGLNNAGQLGNGMPGLSANLPVQVASNVVVVAAGYSHSLFVKTDGTLWAMGLNNYGQLGIDMPGWSTDLPVQVASNVVAVAAGYYHSLFVKADGTLWTMGWNYNGRLGNGTTVDARLPVQVASNVVSVASGNDHSLFVKADGTLWGMGDNSLGQLGVDVAADTTRPVLVMSNVVSAAAGYAHTLFIKADGTLWGMGNNAEGELGFDRAADTTRPVLVTNHVVAAAGGTYHSLFVKADGTLWGMGNNSSGQLGDGTWTTTRQPVLVNGGGLIAVSVARGSTVYHSLAIAGTLPMVSVSNLTLTVGQTTNFTAIVTGDGLFTYQWQFNGTNIVDATNDFYTISSAAVSDAGDYVVLVTGTYGTATSAIATLTVNKMSQAVNFPNIGDQVTTNVVTLIATASSGLSVTNFSVVSGPAVISAGSVSFTNSGSVTLSAVQDGDSRYSASPVETISFMVLASSYTLTVTSAHGGSDPAGTNSYDTPISVMITNSPVFVETTQYVCTGWTGTGSVPASGTTTNTGLFAMTQESTLVWLWATNYLLKVDTIGNGSVSTSNVWLACGTPFQVSATPAPYYHFAGWSGHAEGETSNPLTLAMNSARSVTANFVPNLTPNTSTPEYWLAQYGLTNFNTDALADADLDGMKTWQEYIAGTDPTNAASKFQITQTQMEGAVGTNFVIRWSSVTGKLYAVDATTNLLEGFPLNRGRDILATPNENVLTIRVDRASQEFFRIRIQP